MTTKVISIEDKSVVENLERLAVEVNARKELITFMIQSRTLELSPDTFNKYHDEYLALFKEYDNAKMAFQKAYIDIIPGALDWNLDFNTCSCTITIN